jgi:hypothetical protein
MAEAQCETCGNRYDKPLQITLNGEAHTYDSFECAIEALAPRCDHCGCRVIGHGVEERGAVFCCKSCAAARGSTQLRDRA